MQKNSLRQKLISWLEQDSKISYISLATECMKGKYGRLQRSFKIDTCRRRLDELMQFGHPHYNPNVQPLKENGIVVGWAWNGKPPEKQFMYDTGEKVVPVVESLLPKFLLAYPHARKLSTSN